MGVPKRRPPCEQCGKELKRGQVRFCSQKCAGKSRKGKYGRLDTYICKHCGKTYRPKTNHLKTYCSGGCYFAHKTKKKEAKEETRSAEKWIWNLLGIVFCPICGNEISKRERITKYCSDECRKEKARRDHHKNKTIILSKMRGKYRRNWKPRKSIRCGWCEKVMVFEFGNKRKLYCSDYCADRSVGQNQNHKRRMRQKDAFMERVYRARIYRRDNWRCQICGRKVNPKLKSPHPMRATLDHIKPLAKGGKHEPKNVRLAHMICNSLKGAGVSRGGDQLLLFG
jgi:hypothetical protein